MQTLRSAPILILLTGLASGILHGETQILDETYPDHPNTRVTVESVFGAATRSGALPFRVSIRNGTGRERVWTIELREGNSRRTLQTRVSHQLTVPPGGRVEHELALPFAPEFTTYSYRNLETTIRSPGLPELSRNTGHQTVTNIPTIALSNRLAARSLTRLDKETRDRNSNDPRFGSSFVPDKLPTDWRSFTGIDVLMIDLESWRGISPAQRRAIQEWVRLGGRLEIFFERPEGGPPPASNPLDSIGLPGLLPPEKDSEPARLSLGRVAARFWDGKELDTAILQNYPKLPSRSLAIAQEYDESWDLATDFGGREFRSGLIFALLLAFAILVAPVNLFYLAKQGRRHRLFVTTPIISLGACLVVILIIFIGDGVGGRGHRIAFVDLQPDPGEMRQYVTQEQISRTGVMLSTGFASSRRFSISPVNLVRSAFNLLHRNSGVSVLYQFLPDQYNGGFFRSRSEQGFFLQAAEPTRARIQSGTGKTGPGAPELTSNLPSPVENLVYHDADGLFWQISPGSVVTPGSPIPLVRMEQPDFSKWLKTQTAGFSQSTGSRIESLGEQPGRFFATSSSPGEWLLETHPSIEWEKQFLLLSGTVTGSAETPRPEEDNE